MWNSLWVVLDFMGLSVDYWRTKISIDKSRVRKKTRKGRLINFFIFLIWKKKKVNKKGKAAHHLLHLLNLKLETKESHIHMLILFWIFYPSSQKVLGSWFYCSCKSRYCSNDFKWWIVVNEQVSTMNAELNTFSDQNQNPKISDFAKIATNPKKLKCKIELLWCKLVMMQLWGFEEEFLAPLLAKNLISWVKIEAPTKLQIPATKFRWM